MSLRINCRLLLLTLSLAIAKADVAPAQYVQGPYGVDGTWNVYEFLEEPLTWQEAVVTAQGHSFDGVDGQLVDILSAQENAFVAWLGNDSNLWIGLTDREGAAPTSVSGGLPAPQESRTLPDPHTQGWAWTSGREFAYDNWDVDEPLDYHGAEDAVLLLPNGRWNDMASGYVLDQPTIPEWQPNTSSSESSVFRARSVVEYPLQSLTPLPGITQLTVPPKMPTRLPDEQGADGALRVTDYRGDFEVGNRITQIAPVVAAIEAGDIATTSWTARYPLADLADPDGLATGGPIVQSAASPFPGDMPNTRDPDFISIARHGACARNGRVYDSSAQQFGFRSANRRSVIPSRHRGWTN